MAIRTRRRTRATTDDAPTRPWWKRWWLALLVIPAVVLAAVGLLLFYLLFSAVPLPDDIAPASSVVLDANGNEVGGLTAGGTREDLELDELPPFVMQAVIAAEDRRFYEHRGISFTGIARALFSNIRAGGIEQGGSTIPQQYIKNAEVGGDQTYTRKLREAALAIKLEQAYEKDEILTFYLNTIYWGRGAHGIQAAARTYFDIDASDLDSNQAAMLAGIIASPGNFDPLENPDEAERRRRYTLDGMLRTDAIDQAEHDQLVALGLPEVTERRTVEPGPNAYYLDTVERELRLVPEFSEEAALYQGLRIHTALQPRLQAHAQEVIANAVGTTDGAALVAVDPRTGGVVALAGGPDFETQPLNVALRSPRPVGSTFKPYTLQAFVEAGFSPESRFPAPSQLEVTPTYTAHNFGGTSFGEQTVYQATSSSTNTVFVQMQEEAGHEAVVDAAVRAGLPRERVDELFRTDPQLRPEGSTMLATASLTLGGDGFTPLEMASSYATYANEGVQLRPHVVTRVEDANGALLWEPDIAEEQAVNVNVARAVTHGLVGAVQAGTGRAADLGRPTAGKTGTTTDSRDAWFVGYVPQLAASVWLGNLDNSSIEGDATGGGLAAPVWAEFMRVAVEDLEVEGFTPPDLSGLEVLGAREEQCPDGYAFGEAPTEVDDDGFFPDVLVDITDDQGRPCVEIKPEPEPECPDGFAFADPPGADADPQPEVLEGITDEQGRPCVEIDPQQPEEEDSGDGNGNDNGSGDNGNGDSGNGDDGNGDAGDGDGDDGGGGDDDGDGGGVSNP